MVEWEESRVFTLCECQAVLQWTITSRLIQFTNVDEEVVVGIERSRHLDSDIEGIGDMKTSCAVRCNAQVSVSFLCARNMFFFKST